MKSDDALDYPSEAYIEDARASVLPHDKESAHKPRTIIAG